jgi:hypothetical protein
MVEMTMMLLSLNPIAKMGSIEPRVSTVYLPCIMGRNASGIPSPISTADMDNNNTSYKITIL